MSQKIGNYIPNACMWVNYIRKSVGMLRGAGSNLNRRGSHLKRALTSEVLFLWGSEGRKFGGVWRMLLPVEFQLPECRPQNSCGTTKI